VVQKERKDKVSMKVLKNLTIFLVFFSFIFLLQVHPSYAWLSGFNYRRAITINNTANSNALTDYQVAINLTYSSNMQPDFSDIRFTDTSDSLLSYWIENKVDSAWAYVWVKVPSIPANSTTTIYVYYGNTSVVSSASNIKATFNNKGDDFDDNSLDTNIWSTSIPVGTISEVNQKLNINVPTSTADWWGGSLEYAPVASMTLPSGDFEARVRVESYTVIDASHPGIALWLDRNNVYFWGRYRNDASGHNGLQVEKVVNDVPAGNVYYTPVTTLPIYIGIRKTGTSYSFIYSTNGNTWNTLCTISLEFTPDKFGLHGKKWSTSAAMSLNFDNAYIRKYTDPEPTYSIGEERENRPQITIYLPTNTTYFYSNNFQFSFKATDDQSTTFQLKAFLDGNSIYDNSSYQNNTEIVLTQNLNQVKQYNFTVWANNTQGATSNLTVIFTIKDFEIQQITFNSTVYETTTQSFTETIKVNFDLVNNITANLFWNSTDKGSCSQSVNSTHIILSQAIDIPLVQTNNTQISFFFRNYITYTNVSSTTVDSTSNNQNILFAYQPTVSLSGVVTYNSTYYSNSTTFNFALNNLTASRVNIRIYANSSLIKDDTNLSFIHTPLTDSLYQYQYSISFANSERYFGSTTNIYYLYTIQMNHTLNITFGFWSATPQQSFNFSVYSPYAPYVNCSLLNLYNYTYYRNNMSVWYTYNFPVNSSPISLNFVCRDFFNVNSSVYEYPVYIIQIKPVDEEVGVFNTSLWLDPSTNKTAIIRFVAISPLFNQSILYEKLNSTLWLIVPTNTWILTVQTLYSLQYFTQTYVLRDWTKYDMSICIPENKPQNLQTAYSTVPIDWSFIIRRGDTGCVKTIDKATNSLGNYFGFYFYTLPGIYTVSKLENGTEIFISALRGESENLVDLQKIIYQWQQTLRKIATIVRITAVNVLGGDNSTIVYVTTSMEDDYRLDIERDGSVIYSQTFPSSQNFTLNLLWRTVGINPDDKLTFKLYGSNGLIYQVVSTATGKIYKYSAMFTGIILTVLLIITFLKPINIEKIFILSLVTLFAAFYFIPQTEPNIYLNMLGFGIIVLVVSSGVIAWKTIR
jgi:hypothetical protein